MSSNLGWLFYKDYFSDRDLDYNNLDNPQNKEKLEEKIKKILETNPELELNDDKDLLGNLHIKATTTYPGLLLGSGNMHELPDIKGQLILGFSFDYTTGLPVINGSSIKGVFRSAFKHDKKFKYNEYIKELLKEISKKEFNDVVIKDIEKEIFDNGDIFFDAVVINKGSTILNDDYLAPHKDKNGNSNELVEPTPLRFLKVSPNVTFRFDFDVKNGILSKEEKKELFIKILEDLGLGAKTNVGYGKFSDIEIYKSKKEIRKEHQKIIDKLDSIKELREFINNNPDSELLEVVEKKISEIIKKEKREEDKKKIEELSTIEELELFIRNNQTSELLEVAKEKLKTLKIEQDKDKIKKAWEHLDKKNRKHLETFKHTYKDNEFAKEYILEIDKLLNKEEKVEFDLAPYTKFKPLESYLKRIKSLNNEEIEILKNHLLNNIQDKIKRKKFPFATLQRFMSKEEANEIADKLNLK